MRSPALRLSFVLASACLAFTLVHSSAFAADSGRRLALPAIQVSPALQAREAALSLTPAARLQEFTRILQEKNVSQQNQQTFSSQFQQLPGDLQMSILERTSSRVNSPAVPKLDNRYLSSAMVSGAILALLTPSIGSVIPEQGEASAWSFATGSGLNTNCKATLDGADMESVYLNIPPFLPNTLFFRVPAATSRTTHNLAVINTATSRTSPVMAYKIVSPRGYRGYYGWKFSNFGAPTIPWEMYRDYFGAAAVQYSNGTHRPAAQTWYDHNYKGVGGGGNCFGMSVSSLRFNNHISEGYWNTWFHTAPHSFPYLWWYPWQTESKQSVQEHQGSWLSQEVLDTHATTQTQGARGCFNRVAALVADPSAKPVLVIWGHGSGHAIVPYKTLVSGDDHQMLCYDNNYPYSETESGGPDTTISHVAWGANTFSDPTESWAEWAECMSYAEVTPATPHLPGAYYGGPGSTAAVVSADPGTKMTQITDEGGHTFFNPDGSVNQNPATRIPNSAIVYPLVQVLKGSVALPKLGVRTLQTPTDQPILFVFSQATGKSLNLQFAGAAAVKSLQFYANGISLALQSSGGGTLRAFNILQPSRGFEILNPAAVRPTAIDVIDGMPTGDRVFQLRNLTGLGAPSLFLRPLLDGSRLDIQGPVGLRFDLNLRGPLGQGEANTRFAGLSTQTARGVMVGLDDWERPATSALLLLHLNAAGAVANQVRIAPAP